MDLYGIKLELDAIARLLPAAAPDVRERLEARQAHLQRLRQEILTQLEATP